MNGEYHSFYSRALQKEMALKAYGHGGKPFLVFPSSGGRFFEYEDFGMVGALEESIRAGKIRLFTVDSVDHESWLNFGISPRSRADRHDAYERYILDEVLPFIHQTCGKIRKAAVTGCSMGAYHAANFFFRHPDRFDTVVALSGLYGPKYLLGDYMDDHLYFYFPLLYLPNLEDPAYLEAYRASRLVFCAGQGPWERCDRYDCIGDTLALKQVLDRKGVPAWADLWGYDVSHDWPWWRRQISYFVGKLFFQ